MRTLIEKPTTTRPARSAGSMKPGRAHAGPGHPLNSYIHLPRPAGNQAACRLLEAERKNDVSRVPSYGNGPGMPQAKLTISTPGDDEEQVADRVADQVMRMPDHLAGSVPAAPQLSANPTLQRKCAGCQEESEDALEGRGGPGTEELDGRVAHDLRALHGRGSPLPDSARGFFEPRLGHDFATVRIHTDAAAAGLARSVNARAFTLGPDIVFGPGEYAPESAAGRHLLAHELTHVVQQGGRQRQLQRLAVAQHALTKGTCGQRNVQWIFSLGKPAPADGYIVQKVERSEFVATCPDVAFGPAAPLPTFWEAWFVKKGAKLEWMAATMKYTDGNTRPARPGTNGTDSATGTIKFFSKATTGDLGVDSVAPADPKSDWGPGKVPNSGALPSTSTEPSWWAGTSVEGPANRGVWASWNCCDADKTKHTFGLISTP
jgi:hypothetical protein